jgi:hypothetical protein
VCGMRSNYGGICRVVGMKFEFFRLFFFKFFEVLTVKMASFFNSNG